MSITIKTRIHEGIYKSHGGGKTAVHYEWNTGPRNLMKAADKIESHRKEMDRCYGNVGHVASWVEVDGLVLRESTLIDLDPERFKLDRDNPYVQKTRTQSSREIIEDVKSGILADRYRQIEEMIAESDRRYQEELERADEPMDVWA